MSQPEPPAAAGAALGSFAGEIAAISAPVLKKNASEAFRVKDFRSKCTSFLEQAAALLSGQDLSTDDDDEEAEEEGEEAVDATDLRLLTEEDELQELQRQQEQEQQPAAEAEAAAQAGPLQPAEEGGSQAEEAPAEGSQHGTARLRKAPQQHADFVAGPTAKRARSALPQSSPGQSAERTAEAQTLLTTYQGMVKAMRERREVQRRLTAQTLRSAADPGAGAALLPQPPSSAAAGVATQAAGDGESTREVLMKRGLRRLAECAAEAQTAKPEERVSPGEVLLQVAVHFPHAPEQVSEEWVVLGSQRLCVLRDALFCVVDTNVKNMEREENEQRAARGEEAVQQYRPGAYFYIEGTFYNDTRLPEAGDLSAPVLSAAQEADVEAPPHPPPGAAACDELTTEFSVAAMEGTAFEGLWLRLGPDASNLYCHQGGCEHRLVFQDVRVFDPAADPPLTAHYPFRLSSSIVMRQQQCEVCTARTARRVTYDDPAAPHSPFLWCEECLLAMHGPGPHPHLRSYPYTSDCTPWVAPGRGQGARAVA